jgi:NAD-dependent DNA ligase
MTGFRDKELAGAVEAVGGKVGDSVSKNTAYVVLKDLAEDSGKANKARELGIPLILVDDFKKLL